MAFPHFVRKKIEDLSIACGHLAIKWQGWNLSPRLNVCVVKACVLSH